MQKWRNERKPGPLSDHIIVIVSTIGKEEDQRREDAPKRQKRRSKVTLIECNPEANPEAPGDPKPPNAVSLQ